MKRALVILAVLLFAASASAMSSRPHKPDNWNILGSDDRQNRGGYTVPVDPDRPVSPVPEPATLLLLGAGLVGIAAWARKK